MLRNLTTNLLYHGKIRTTVTRAKEVRGLAERLITLAVAEKDNFDKVQAEIKIPKRDANGNRIKKEENGKMVTQFETVQRTIYKDKPSRLAARRKMLSVLYPVTVVPQDGRKKRSLSQSIDMPRKLFEEIAPKYVDRKGGYTRIIRIGQRKGDGAEEAFLELV
jgi:large subunit ribosomal protein L17